MSDALNSWIGRLRVEGSEALRELVRGSASLGPLSAAEPEDALAAILDFEPRESALFHSFDKACQALLDEFRATVPQTDAKTLRIELSRLYLLMSIIRRLRPDETVFSFHRHFALWSGFFENFVLDQSFDLGREFFRILALSQDGAASKGLEARRLRRRLISAEPQPH